MVEYTVRVGRWSISGEVDGFRATLLGLGLLALFGAC